MVSKQWKEKEVKEKKLLAGELYTAKDRQRGCADMGQLMTEKDRKEGIPLGELFTKKDKEGLM